MGRHSVATLGGTSLSLSLVFPRFLSSRFLLCSFSHSLSLQCCLLMGSLSLSPKPCQCPTSVSSLSATLSPPTLLSTVPNLSTPIPSLSVPMSPPSFASVLPGSRSSPLLFLSLPPATLSSSPVFSVWQSTVRGPRSSAMPCSCAASFLQLPRPSCACSLPAEATSASAR